MYPAAIGERGKCGRLPFGDRGRLESDSGGTRRSTLRATKFLNRAILDGWRAAVIEPLMPYSWLSAPRILHPAPTQLTLA